MGERLTIELTALAHGGEALGRHAGRVIFVPYAAPGETVRVETIAESKGWGRARLLEILKPSPERVVPPCPYFGRCTGCQFQHLDYAAQLRLKREVVSDQLARLGRLHDVEVRATLSLDNPWRYRNQARLYPTPAGALGIKAGPQARPVAVDECLLFHPALDELFAALDIELEGLERLDLRVGARTGEALASLKLAGDEEPELEVDLPVSLVLLQRDGDVRVLIGDEWIYEEIAGRRLRISALSPFPANSALAERLVELAGAWLAPRPDEVLLDIGAGVGLFGLSLLGAVSGVVAVEENPWAAADLLANAGAAAAAGVIEAPLSEGLAEIEGGVDIAILQAPRGGLGPAGIAQVARLGPRRLLYVAEDPAPLGRDAAGLEEAGYHLGAVQPADLLPQTYHIAVLGLWERR